LSIVLVVTVMASLIPAIRAARVEPMQALREE
jgi:ABC-type lipoprotein release transport system permease subunit